MRTANAAALAPSTMLPSFDLEDFAQDIGSERPGTLSGFAAVYARVIDGNFTLEEATSVSPPESGVVAVARALPFPEERLAAPSSFASDLDRAMYTHYLESDFPEALSFAEKLLENEPEHALARLVALACIDAIDSESFWTASPTMRVGSFG